MLIANKQLHIFAYLHRTTSCSIGMTLSQQTRYRLTQLATDKYQFMGPNNPIKVNENRRICFISNILQQWRLCTSGVIVEIIPDHGLIQCSWNKLPMGSLHTRPLQEIMRSNTLPTQKGEQLGGPAVTRKMRMMSKPAEWFCQIIHWVGHAWHHSTTTSTCFLCCWLTEC